MTQNTVAKVAQGALVVSLKNAKNPTVWRARLDSLDEARFSVESGGKGLYKLQLHHTGKTAGETLAGFTTKAAAEQALEAITDVLFNLEDLAPAAATPGASNDALAAPVMAAAAPTAQDNAAMAARVEKSMSGWRVFYWLVFVLIFLAGFLLFMGARMSTPGERPVSMGGIESGAPNGGLPERPNRDTMGGDVDDMPEPPEGRPLSADEFFKNR